MNKDGKRVKRKIPKFLEIEELQELEKPLFERAKKAASKNKYLLKCKEQIAIRDFAVLTLVYSCALRISEAVNLKMINIDLKRQYIRVCDSKGDDRMVYIPDPTIDVLKQWLEIRPENNNPYFFCNVKGTTRPGEEPKPLGRDYYNKLISRLADETGVRLAGGQELQKPHPHTLRHTRAMNYLDSGIDLNVIQKLLGHKNLATTQVYAEVRQEVTDNVQKENTNGILSF